MNRIHLGTSHPHRAAASCQLHPPIRRGAHNRLCRRRDRFLPNSFRGTESISSLLLRKTRHICVVCTADDCGARLPRVVHPIMRPHLARALYRARSSFELRVFHVLISSGHWVVRSLSTACDHPQGPRDLVEDCTRHQLPGCFRGAHRPSGEFRRPSTPAALLVSRAGACDHSSLPRSRPWRLAIKCASAPLSRGLAGSHVSEPP